MQPVLPGCDADLLRFAARLVECECVPSAVLVGQADRLAGRIQSSLFFIQSYCNGSAPATIAGMASALAIFGITYAAFCVWLAVRIVNRRERWAKRALAAVGGAPVLYFASFGPACWLCEHGIVGQKAAWLAYRPLMRLYYHSVYSPHVPLSLSTAIAGYARIWGDKSRLETIADHEPLTGSTSFSLRNVCGADSVSPIDYEVAYAQRLDHEARLAKFAKYSRRPYYKSDR